MAETLAERAAKAFQAQQGTLPGIGPVLAGTIPTNRAFRPDVIDAFYGLDPDANPPEVPIASEALMRGMLEELAKIAPALTIQQWIKREAGKLGGNGQLAAALLGIPYKRGAMGKNRRYKNTLRALQRSSTSAKEAHKGMAEEYRKLVADFPGGELGNPYTLASIRGGALLRANRVQIRIMGDWSISEDVEEFVWKGTNFEPDDKDEDGKPRKKPYNPKEDPHPLEPIFVNPANLVDIVLDYMQRKYLHGMMPTLERIYGLSMVVGLAKS